jgi:hypothetical protein
MPETSRPYLRLSQAIRLGDQPFALKEKNVW